MRLRGEPDAISAAVVGENEPAEEAEVQDTSLVGLHAAEKSEDSKRQLCCCSREELL
jgi:hypothetical protein